MSVEKKKPMGAYPVTLTDGGFTLNGHEFATKPTLGQRGQNGQRAYAMPVKSGGTGRQWVIISNGKDRRRLLNPYNFRGLQLALWPDCTGSPYCNRGPIDNTAAPQWDGAATVIDNLERYYYDDALHATVAEGETAPTLSDLLSWEGITLLDSHPGTSLPRAAVTVSLYDGTGGSLIGQLLREYELDGTWTQTGEWIHIAADPIGALPTNNVQRRQGYLFYDKSSDTYTIAAQDGLLLCTRGNEPTPNLCAWANTYGDTPGNSSVSIAGGFAIAGSMGAYDAAFGVAADCAVDLYSRGESAWAHIEQVVLGDQLSGCDYVYSCGVWNPQQDTGELDSLNAFENTRWPYLAGEWYVWLSGIAGQAGPSNRPTVAKAKLLAIRAATGTIRVVAEETADNTLFDQYEDILDDIEERLTYQSTPHPANWVDEGFPVGYVDEGGANGWSAGPINPNPGIQAGIEADHPEDIPEHLGRGEPGDPIGFVQQIKNFTGMTTDRDPTVAPDSQKLECGGGEATVHFPRGIVDQVASRIYLATRESHWLSATVPDTGDEPAEEDYSYTGGNYYDFPAGEIPGVTDFWVRVWRWKADVTGSRGFGGDVGLQKRLVLRKYSTNALLDTLDLTREFTETIDGNAYHYLRAPDVFEMGHTTDHVWLLAADYWAVDDVRLTMILVDKSTLSEVDRLDLSPDTGREWQTTPGRPQMLVGVDGTGAWAEVFSWWTGTPASWVAQEVRIDAGSLVVATLAESASSSSYPEKLMELANVAISPLKQFWIEAGVDFKVREE